MKASLLLLFLVPIFLRAAPQQAVVVVPVADVWSRPLADGEKPADDLRETQVLFGEKVLIHESSGPWVRIEAVEQPEFTHHNKWEGYPGWTLQRFLNAFPGNTPKMKNSFAPQLMRGLRWAEIVASTITPRAESYLSLGSVANVDCSNNIRSPFIAIAWESATKWTATAGFPNCFLPRTTPQRMVDSQRVSILGAAQLFMNVPYLWGGLTPGSPQNPSSSAVSEGQFATAYGADCSGLVHLSYRTSGISIPRDAHEQWMKAIPIHRKDLKFADLIFSAKKENPKKITHVALFYTRDMASDAWIIEAPQTGLMVRTITFKEKYGKPLEEVESGDRVGERVIYFGSFLQ